MHNYQKKIAKLLSEGKLPSGDGKAYDWKVSHDNWCLVYNGGECNCDPDISYVEITDQNRKLVAEQVAKDTEEFREEIKKKTV